MAPKKEKVRPSVDPKLYEKCMKPAMTIAMGMKPCLNSTSCWRAQVEAEERIHKNWARKYDSKGERRRIAALEHTLQREKSRHDAYHKDNDALYTTLYRKDAVNPREASAQYLKLRKEISPQEKYTKPQTSAQEVGWKVPSVMKNENHFVSSHLFHPEKRTLQSTAAYRRPDDRDHAELFGYTFDYTH